MACLSSEGIGLLQQRCIFHLTRLVVDLPRISQANSSFLTEVELQYDWSEAALDAADPHHDPSDVLASAEKSFQSFLSEQDGRLRAKLSEQRLHADLRWEVRREIQRRFGNTADK